MGLQFCDTGEHFFIAVIYIVMTLKLLLLSLENSVDTHSHRTKNTKFHSLIVEFISISVIVFCFFLQLQNKQLHFLHLKDINPLFHSNGQIIYEVKLPVNVLFSSSA